MYFPGYALREERQALGLTQQELASISGIRAAVIAAYEQGAIMPCDQTIRTVLLAIARAQKLHRLHGFVPLDDNAVRWFREELVTA